MKVEKDDLGLVDYDDENYIKGIEVKGMIFFFFKQKTAYEILA